MPLPALDFQLPQLAVQSPDFSPNNVVYVWLKEADASTAEWRITLSAEVGGRSPDDTAAFYAALSKPFNTVPPAGADPGTRLIAAIQVEGVQKYRASATLAAGADIAAEFSFTYGQAVLDAPVIVVDGVVPPAPGPTPVNPTGLQTISFDVGFADAPGTVDSVTVPPANSFIVEAYVEVLTAFDGAADTLILGHSGSTNLLLALGDVDLTTPGVYGGPVLQRFGASALAVRATLAGALGTTGTAVVTVVYGPELPLCRYASCSPSSPEPHRPSSSLVAPQAPS